MKELTIQAWCDVCQDSDTPTEATVSVTMSVDLLAKELDLCDEHGDIVRQAQVFLQTYGVAPLDGPARPNLKTPLPTTEVGKRTCPICGTVCEHRQAMRDHLKRTHQTTLARLGLTKPRGRYAQQVNAEIAAKTAKKGSR